MCSFVVGGGDTILASHAVVCDVYALMHVNVNSCVCVCVCVCIVCHACVSNIIRVLCRSSARSKYLL